MDEISRITLDTTPPSALDCKRMNCKILNPINPAVWCRECLAAEVSRCWTRLRKIGYHLPGEYDY